MISDTYPILEYDSGEALIEPARIIRPLDVPEHCVLCFFREVIEKAVREHNGRVICTQKSEMGDQPLYEIDLQGRRLGLFHPGVGAPLAAGLLDELIARGCRKFIACGSCGVLDPEIAVGHLLVPTAAVRDEGTSYHYLPPSREVEASPEGVAAIEAVLRRARCEYLLCKAWTTDGFYRETPARIQRRKAEGCLVVEMEAAAFFAVARFRGVTLAQLLYGGDDVSGSAWDSRDWHLRSSIREQLFWLAAEACLVL